MLEATLYEHEDGRQAVSFIVPAPFTHGHPKWHRVGPVQVHGVPGLLPDDAIAQALRQVGLKHKLGPSYDYEDLCAAFEAGLTMAASHPPVQGKEQL